MCYIIDRGKAIQAALPPINVFSYGLNIGKPSLLAVVAAISFSL